MNFSRKTILVVGAALLAACGDKVTVQEYTPPAATPATPKVNSVSVAPANATLNVGQSITMTAAVNADAGLATTVTWSSSDATKASVSAAGVVTGVAVTPGVAICATSTVDTGKKGCASIVVQAATTTVPASISIQSITSNGYAINKDSVSGIIDVRLNVLPGNQTVSKVVLLVAGVRADSQTFTAAQSAALRYEADEAAAGQTAFPEIVFSVNTKAYNATTGVPSWANGTKAVSAQLYTVAGGSATAASASAAQNLTFNNADAVYGSWTLPSTKVQAADANGYQWTSLGGGNLTLSVVPVLYSGKTASSMTIKYGTNGTTWNATDKVSCASRASLLSYTGGAIAGTGACWGSATFGDTATTKTLSTFPGSVTFGLWDEDLARGTSDANVINPPVPTFNLIYSDGTTVPSANISAATGTSLALRIDNKAPADVTLRTPGGSTAGYYRAAFTFTQYTGATADSLAVLPTAPGTDNGVSNGSTFSDARGSSFKVYTSAKFASATDSAAVSTTPIASVASLADGYYCLRVQWTDKLGNASLYPESVVATAGTAAVASVCPTWGAQSRGAVVDNTAPTMTWATTSWSQVDTAVAVAIPADADYKYVLTEANLGTTQVRACQRTTSSNSVIATNVANLTSSSTTTGAACANFVTQATYGGISGLISVATTKWAASTVNVEGMYTLEAKHTDLAGNAQATTLTRYVMYDPSAPTVTAPAAISTSLGSTASMAGYISDNLDVRQAALTAAIVGYSSTSGVYNPAFNSAGARVAPVLEDGSTVLNAALANPSSTRFFNVAVSGSSAIQYISPLSVTGDTIILGQAHPVTSGNSGNDGLGLVNGFRTKFAFRGYDQAGNTALSGYTANTIVDSISTFAVTSRFAVVGNGLINASDSTVADAGTTGAATSVIKVAMTTTLAAANAGYSNSKALVLKLKQFRFQDKTGHMVRALAYKQANNYCATNAAAATTQVVDANGSESLMAAGSQIVSTRVPASNAAPTVYVYAPLVGGSSWGLVGTMTDANQQANQNTAGYCDDTVIRTYTYTWTLSSRLPATQWSNGQLLYVIVGAQGQAAIARGPFVDLVK